MSELKNLYGLDLLRELSLTFGPTGCEDNVAETIKRIVKDYADEVKLDKMGNLTAVLYGTNHGTENEKRLQISAHMDEVGFMVTDINGDGTLKFALVGGIIPSVLGARRVTVGDENSRVNGVIGSKAIHLQRGDEGSKMPSVDGFYVDIGAKDKEEAEKYVKKGSFGTFISEFCFYGEDDKYVKGKAIDDRFGCSVMCDLIRRLSDGEKLPHDVYFAFTVREEVGLSGAKTATYKNNPDFAIVLEATAVADNTGEPEERRVAVLGDGPAISFMDRSTIYNKEVYEYVLGLAKEKGIKAQPKKFVSGGNDAGSIHRIRAGVKVTAISAPSRYIHTACNVIHKDDYASTLDLVTELVKAGKFDF